MKTALQILLIIALIGLGLIQILYAKGFFGKDELIPVCPVKAISMQNGKAVIDPVKCIGCQRCVIGVPGSDQHSSTAVKTTVPDSIAITKTESVPKSEPVAKAIPATKAAKESSKLTYTVNPETCIGCNLCVLNCPAQAITLVDGKAIIDNSKCIQCDICVSGNKADFQGCPVQAISKR